MIPNDANRSITNNGTPAEPTMRGAFGLAWLIELPDPDQRRTKDESATVSYWLCHVPGAHPAWSYYAIAAIHLREIPGAKAAKIKTPGATHELFVFSVSPDQGAIDLAKVGRGEQTIDTLRPIDHVVQFQVRDDADAAALVESAIRAIMAGQLSPDQDFRALWRTVVAATASHIVAGAHDAGENSKN